MRWPLEPLMAATGLTVHQLAKRCRIGGDYVDRFITRGFTDEQADRYAVRCGLTAGEVWDGWYAAGLTVMDELFLYGSATSEPGWRQAALCTVHRDIHTPSTTGCTEETRVVPLTIPRLCVGESQCCDSSVGPGGCNHPDPEAEMHPHGTGGLDMHDRTEMREAV